MIPGESIDSMFSRFADIANPLKSLGAEIPVKEPSLQNPLRSERYNMGT